ELCLHLLHHVHNVWVDGDFVDMQLVSTDEGGNDSVIRTGDDCCVVHLDFSVVGDLPHPQRALRTIGSFQFRWSALGWVPTIEVCALPCPFWVVVAHLRLIQLDA